MKFNLISTNPEHAKNSVFFLYKPSTIFCIHINLSCTFLSIQKQPAQGHLHFHSSYLGLALGTPAEEHVGTPSSSSKGGRQNQIKPACDDKGHPAVKRNSHTFTSE